MQTKLFQSAIFSFMTLMVFASSAWAQPIQVIDFEDFNIGAEVSFKGPTDNSVVAPGKYGPEFVGTIDVGGVQFLNRYSVDYGSWSGFSIAKGTDTATAGVGNQFSSFTGGGANGSSQYAIAFGYHDLQVNSSEPEAFDPTNTTHLHGLPSLYLPHNTQALSFDVTNTTYAALSMLEGDSFAKKFGGPSGNDPDFFDLKIYGIDRDGNVLSNFITVSLADYTFADNSLDFILSEWQTIDLSSLSDANSLHFNLVSSDAGVYGMNTPGYFAMDNLTIAAVPEPTSMALLCAASLTLAAGGKLRRRRKQIENEVSYEEIRLQG